MRLYYSSLLLVSSKLAASSVTALQCATGWKAGESREIPADWINDGYCDCPLDGADEPDTDACSGSQAWPGIAPSGGDDASER